MEENQKYKKVITYDRIWIVRVFALIVVILFEKHLHDVNSYGVIKNGPLGIIVYSVYENLCDMSEFWENYESALVVGLNVFLIGAIVCYAIAFILQKENTKTAAKVDIITDISVCSVFILAFALLMYATKGHVYGDALTIWYFVRIALMLLLLAIHFYEYRRNKDLFERENEVLSKLIIGLQVVFLVVVGCLFVRTIKIYEDYKYLYGVYANEKHNADVQLEDKIGNYRATAVANGSELYFYKYDRSIENRQICKVTRDGKLEKIISLSEIKAEIDCNDLIAINSLDYYNGKLYFTVHEEQNTYLICLNLEDKNVLLLEKIEDQIDSVCAVKADMLYIMKRADKLSNYNIYCVNISEDMELNQATLLLGNVEEYNYSNIRVNFYNKYIYDEVEYSSGFAKVKLAERRLKKSGYVYDIAGVDKKYDQLIRFENPDYETIAKNAAKSGKVFYESYKVEDYDEIAENILRFNVYGDNIFYLQYDNGATRLIKTDLDGNNCVLLKDYHGLIDTDWMSGRNVVGCPADIMLSDRNVLVGYYDKSGEIVYDVVIY